MKERLNILGRDSLIKLLLNLPLCVQHLSEISEVARKQGVFHLQGQLFHTLQRFHNRGASVFVGFYLSLENPTRASCRSRETEEAIVLKLVQGLPLNSESVYNSGFFFELD